MSPRESQPKFIGSFLVIRKIGEGGMGVVYAGFDTTLERSVALKVIRRQFVDDLDMKARMIREAQAMARLSHPNVVQVYQAGEYGDEVYLAMEYVEGQTLSGWLRSAPRSWRQILRTVVAAGRGLAAAHKQGMIHRDFKPDNVLVGADERVCVADFGLAHANEVAPSLGISKAHDDINLSTFSRIPTIRQARDEIQGLGASETARLTQSGEMLGTPIYMSPEQHYREEVGPKSDQYSFSVTLYEALYGVRPFMGQTLALLREEVRRGRIPLPPRDSKVPRRIFRIIVRGLAPGPETRWPTLGHMLDELERDPRRTLVRAVGVGAFAVAAAVGSYATAVARQGAAEQCQDAGRELVGVWDEERAGAAERAFAATGAAYAADTWQRVRTRLDAYALAWTTEHTRACEAHVSGAQSTRLFDIRTRCLARRKVHLAALVEVFAGSDRSVLEHAVQATAALPSMDSCGDAEALLAAAAPPDDPETAAQVESWRGRLARAAALEGTGQYVRGLELMTEVRVAAEGLRYAPLVAEVALAEGSLLMAVARADEAEVALTRALRSGLALGLDALSAEAAAKRIFVIGDGQGRREVALEGEAVAEGLAERAHDERVTALLHNNLGVVLADAGQADRARAHYLQTIALLGRQATPDPLIGVVHHNLGGLERDLQRLDAARGYYAEAARLFAELLGDQHPLVAHPIGGMADVDTLGGHFEAATTGYQRELTLMEAAYGVDHLYLLHPLLKLGQARARDGDADAAKRLFRRAVAIGDQHRTTHPMYAEALAGLAGQVEATDAAEARTLMASALKVVEASGGPALAELLVHAGQMAARSGEVEKARERFTRVLSLTTGRKEQVEARGLAALELARTLPAAESDHACELLAEAMTALTGEPRDAAVKLHASTCAGP